MDVSHTPERHLSCGRRLPVLSIGDCLQPRVPGAGTVDISSQLERERVVRVLERLREMRCVIRRITGPEFDGWGRNA
jgi:hypothetical protein